MRFVAGAVYPNVTVKPWKVIHRGSLNPKNPQPVCISDIGRAELAKSLKSALRTEGICAAAFVPLVADGKLIGKFVAYVNA